MEPSESVERKIIQRTTLRVIYAMSFVDLFAVGVIFPFLTPYVKSLGCTNTQVGILASIYAAIQVISGPVIGSWSDVRGRKQILFVTLVISTLCYFFMGFCTSVASIFVFRFLLGAFKHTQTLNKAIIADITGNDRQLNTAIYGRCTAFGSMGFVVGPVIGGHLGELDHGFQIICSLTAILFVINIILVTYLPDLEPSRKHEEPMALTQELKAILDDLNSVDWSTYWSDFTIKFLYILTTTMFFANQPIYLQQVFGYGSLEVGYVISFISFVGVLCGFYMIPISRYVYHLDEPASLRTLHAFLILSVCFLGFFSVSNIYIFALMLLPFGVCNTVLRIVTMDMLFEKCKESERGSLMGAADSMMAMGRFMAPMTAGFITDKTSAMGVMFFAAIVSVVGSVVSYHMYIEDRMKMERSKED